MPFAWTCPFCGRDTTIVNSNLHVDGTFLTIKNADGFRHATTSFVVCPNETCGKFTLSFYLHEALFVNHVGWKQNDSILKEWRLIPQSDAKVFPEYIPKAIRADYLEASSVKELSPKASATLARRCLQGMIRDFWQVKKKNLKAAIDAIKSKVDGDTWKAIEAIRKVGNIGAHMEKDVNLVIDVEPDEAEKLIALIELLMSEWYIARQTRKDLTTDLIVLAEKKNAAKKPASSGESVVEKGVVE